MKNKDYYFDNKYNNNTSEKNKLSWIDKILLLCVTVALLIIAYIKMLVFIAETKTDFLPHINQAIHLKSIFKVNFSIFMETAPLKHAVSYPGWHVSYLLFCKLLGMIGIPDVYREPAAAALLTAVIIIITMLVIGFVFFKLLKGKHTSKLVPFFSFIMIFCGPLYVPAVNESYYLGQIFSGVWHNPTLQPLKIFAIIIFFLYCYMWENRESLQAELGFRKISKLNYFFFLISILLAFSAVFKTSLVLVYIPALFVFCCADVISTRFKSIDFCIKTGLSILPTIIIIFIQFIMLRDLSGTNIIILPMAVWRNFSNNPFLSMIISLPFPIFAIGVCHRQIYRNKMLFFSLILFIISLLEYIFLAVESKPYYGDFSWGMHLCALIILIVTFIVFYNDIHKKSMKKLKTKIIAFIGYFLLFLQFLYGFDVFINPRSLF